MSFRSLVLFFLAVPCFATPLGSATDFNVFLFGNITQSNVDVTGRLAVGNNATLTNFGVGSALNNPASGTRYDLIVGNTLNYNNGQVFHGSILYNNGSLSGVGTPNGVTLQSNAVSAASGINFAQTATDLQNLSLQLSNLPGQIAGIPVNNQLTLSGSNTDLNVFQVAAGVFNGSINTFNINAPSSSTVIINVLGASNTFQNGGAFINGVQSATAGQRILFNFVNTTSLTISSYGFRGSILAPQAAVSFNNGSLDGQLIAQSLSGNGESHNYLFQGNINGLNPAASVPEPSTLLSGIALVGLALVLRRQRRKKA
jgi:choice-of-anchor A domain-containing protein